MSFLDRTKASVEKCKIRQLLNYHHDKQYYVKVLHASDRLDYVMF